MHIYNKFSKVGISLCLSASILMLYSCGTNVNESTKIPQNIIKNDNHIAQNNIATADTFKDWTFDRVDSQLKKGAFSTKSSADSLKPDLGINVNISSGLVSGLSTTRVAIGKYFTVSGCEPFTNVPGDTKVTPPQLEVGCNPVDNSSTPGNPLTVVDSPSVIPPKKVGAVEPPVVTLQDKLYLAAKTALDPELKVGDSIVVDETGENFLIKEINRDATSPYNAVDTITLGNVVPNDSAFVSSNLESGFPGSVKIITGGNVVTGTDTKFMTTFGPLNGSGVPLDPTTSIKINGNFPGTVGTIFGTNTVTGSGTNFLKAFGHLTPLNPDPKIAISTANPGTPDDPNASITINGFNKKVLVVTSDTTLNTGIVGVPDNWPDTLTTQNYSIPGALTRKIISVDSDTSLTIAPPASVAPFGPLWNNSLSGKTYVKVGQKPKPVTITLDRIPGKPITGTNGSTISVVTNSSISNTNTPFSGRISTTAGSKVVTGSFGVNFQAELKKGDNIKVEKTGEILVVATVNTDPAGTAAPSFTSTENANFSASNSIYKLSFPKNSRAKSFGAMSIFPLIDTVNNVLFYTSDNDSGSNFFAMNAKGEPIWEHSFNGGFWGNSPTISPKTHLGQRIIYLAGKNGDIYAINTDGVLAATIKVNDTFKDMSLALDSSDSDLDYVYAAGQSGNFYRFKLDFSNSQVKTFSLVYSSKIDETSFSSSPVFDGTSVYLGGENGVLYEIIPNTGQPARSWDLSLYPRNGSAKIIGSPFVGLIPSGKVIIVPAGGYLFRIVGSTVTQSPLLELRNGVNSSNLASGSVFTSDGNPTGTIISWPFTVPGAVTNKVYISNANAIFEMDYSSIDSFKNSANYCVSISGRKGNLLSLGNGNLAISPSGAGDGSFKAAMVDINTAKNSTVNINFFSLPLNPGVDSLVSFMPLNEFDVLGYPLSGEKANSVADGTGKIYFALDNGTVNVLPTP